MEHPYVPRDLQLPGYVACSLSQSTILGGFGFASLFVVLLVWIVSGKEYSKADSRYARRDTAIVTVGGINAILLGPASLLAMYAIAKGKGYSYILQFAVSLGQLYGVVVYFGTGFLDGDNFAVSPYYYYAYYVVVNSLWFLIPPPIVAWSWKKISLEVQGQAQKKNKVP